MRSKAGKSRKEALQAAYDRFYRGDVADEFVRGAQEQGGQITKDDLANWRVKLEEPRHTTLSWHRRVQARPLDPGPGDAAGAQHPRELRPEGDGLQQRRYIHTVYQAISLAFADRDFYYGDPYFPPEEPIKGLLSKDYARQRARW